MQQIILFQNPTLILDSIKLIIQISIEHLVTLVKYYYYNTNSEQYILPCLNLRYHSIDIRSSYRRSCHFAWRFDLTHTAKLI